MGTARRAPTGYVEARPYPIPRFIKEMEAITVEYKIRSYVNPKLRCVYSRYPSPLKEVSQLTEVQETESPDGVIGVSPQPYSLLPQNPSK